MLTWSVVNGLVQGPLLTSHWKIFSPTVRPLTEVPGSFAFAKIPVPCTRLHVPLAGNVTALPASVVVLVGEQSS